MPDDCCYERWESVLENNEPVFIIRGNDALAVEVVNFWVSRAHLKGVSEEKLNLALNHRDAIMNFQIENPEKVKIPD